MTCWHGAAALADYEPMAVRVLDKRNGIGHYAPIPSHLADAMPRRGRVICHQPWHCPAFLLKGELGCFGSWGSLAVHLFGGEQEATTLARCVRRYGSREAAQVARKCLNHPRPDCGAQRVARCWKRRANTDAVPPETSGPSRSRAAPAAQNLWPLARLHFVLASRSTRTPGGTCAVGTTESAASRPQMAEPVRQAQLMPAADTPSAPR